MTKIQTGPWLANGSILALYRFYVNASDGELEELNTTRDDVLRLIRSLENDVGQYALTELDTIADQMLRAYRAGRSRDTA